MAIIQLILALIILGFIYRWMIRNEIPEPISKPQAAVPVVLGVLSVPVSFIFVLILGTLLLKIGYSKTEVPMVVRSVVAAFFGAGFPEEIAKLLMIVITILIFSFIQGPDLTACVYAVHSWFSVLQPLSRVTSGAGCAVVSRDLNTLNRSARSYFRYCGIPEPF